MVTAINLDGATVQDGAGNAANLSLAGLSQGSPQIDTTAPTVTSVVATAGDYDTGKTVTLTLAMSEAVTVIGTPTLTLNDGGTATYSGGSGTSALTFSYTVGAGQNTSTLAATAVNGTITDLAGNVLSTANLPASFTGVVIDTLTPTISSLVESPSSGDFDAGKTVTLTLNLSEAVTVAGGTPTLSLNDGGTATYSGGSGTSALTFSYTVGAGQNTSALTATAVNLNAATITDGAGNAASLSLSGLTQSGPQIDTVTPVIVALVESPASGDFDAGKTVTLTLNLTAAVTVAGGTPTLTLNDGGTATYSGGSGTSALTFSYTVGAGQNTSALTATAVNLNAATITDGAGNAANLSLSGLTQSGPQIDTTAPTVSSLVESPASGDLDGGKTVTLTLNLSEAVTVAGGTPTLTLNDGGTAIYSGGSGTTALTFSYTVGAGQNTSALTATAVNLNAATITDGAGNAANLSLSGLTQSGPQIDTVTPAAPLIANDTINGNSSVTLSGTAAANSTVTVYDQQTEAGTTIASASGGWTYTTGLLASGAQAFTATATDAAGNVSVASQALDVTINTPPPLVPPAPVITTDTVNGNTVALTGTVEADTTVTVYDQQGFLGAKVELGTTVANASGSWSFATGALTSGSYFFYAKATNAAGNTSPFSAGLDPTIGPATPTDPPAPLTVTGTTEIAQASSANIAFQSGDAGVLVLDQPSTFTGTVSGFGAQNGIDLPSIAFGPQTTLGYLPNSNQTGGTLSVTDGSHGANIALLGNYIASSFATAGDGHGGTMVVAEASQNGTQSLLTNPQHT